MPKKVSEDDEKKGGGGVSSGGGGGGDPSAPPPPPPPGPPPPDYYGTFEGVRSYHPPAPPQPAMGFPQPVPPPGAGDHSDPSHYYAQGYQTVPGYAIAEGRPVREGRLPCCGIGCGWLLFIIGFFLAAIPWYIGVVILICSRIDYREKPGYIACTIAAVLATIAVIFGATGGADDW